MYGAAITHKVGSSRCRKLSHTCKKKRLRGERVGPREGNRSKGNRSEIATRIGLETLSRPDLPVTIREPVPRFHPLASRGSNNGALSQCPITLRLVDENLQADSIFGKEKCLSALVRVIKSDNITYISWKKAKYFQNRLMPIPYLSSLPRT
jgi:hypothetical protein